jgi:N-methylhydantoinase A
VVPDLTPTYALGIDIGGTFTDAALVGPGGIVAVAKHLTTPARPADGALAAAQDVLGQARIEPISISRVVHGTTLATNAILERRGGPVALVTTKGFGDLLRLGRHARVEEDRYDPAFVLPPPPVDPTLTFAVRERVGPRGEVIEALDESEVVAVGRLLGDTEVVGVAVCLLHAYANPVHEARIGRLLREHLALPIVLSSEVSPEVREYERLTTTVMSAIVGPIMAGYLRELEHRLQTAGIGAPMYVMESSGGVMSAEQAIRRAIATVESGPAAGVIAAKVLGAQTGRREVIAFDMGGTTAKAAVIRNGEPDVSYEFEVGGHGSFGIRRSGTGVPIRIPAIDLAEVGAGGGSIAWLDSQATLHVGPRSAGASPGPACYGQGGSEPTVTDANVVLGYLELGRRVAQLEAFDPELSRRAVVARLAEPLGVRAEAAAAAVVDIANATMVGAIHVVTVQRGTDPRRYALVTSGGAGPLHAAAIARRCGIDTVLVPPACGVASAFGLLASDVRTDLVRSVHLAEDAFDPVTVESVFRELEAAGAATLAESGPGDLLVCQRSLDLRYRRQAHHLTLDIDRGPVTAATLSDLGPRFFTRHEATYGVGRPGPIEVVNQRVRVTRHVGAVPFRRQLSDPGSASPVVRHRGTWSSAIGDFVETPVVDRLTCPPGYRIVGPALLEEPEATTFVPLGWSATTLTDGAVVLTAAPSDPAAEGPR